MLGVLGVRPRRRRLPSGGVEVRELRERERRASGMSLFSVGGNIGFALGPLARLVLRHHARARPRRRRLRCRPGADRRPGAPCRAPAPRAFRARARSPGAPRPRAGNDWRGTSDAARHRRPRAASRTWACSPSSRSTRSLAGTAPIYGTRLLALFLFAGAIGTLFGGPLADRVGRRRVLLGSFIVSPPLIAVYVLVGGAGRRRRARSSPARRVIGTFSVSLVMSQEYMPGRVGMASGLSIGMAIGLGGVAALGARRVADAVDLETAVLATALGPALCVILTPPPALAAYAPARSRSRRPPRPLMPRPPASSSTDLKVEDRRGSERTRGLTASYRFDVDGAGSWRVDVDDGAISVSESDAPPTASSPSRRACSSASCAGSRARWAPS